MIKKHSKGFTLIELLIYVGTVAIMTIGIYTIYNGYTLNQNIAQMERELKVIDNSIQQKYSSLLTYGTLTNASAISSNIIPNQLVPNGSTTVINNRFGGQLNVAAQAIGGEEGYRIDLTELSPSVCSKLALTPFAFSMEQIFINNGNINNVGERINTANIETITTRCNNSESNTISYRNKIIRPNLLPEPESNPLRNKESPDYIATVGNVSAGALACAGGTVSNGSFCACPSGTEWSGSQCVAFGSNTLVGWCPRGQGWLPGTRTCSALPYTASTGAVGNTYQAGRNLPSNITTPATQTVTAGRTVPNAKTSADPEIISGRRITWEQGQLDDRTVQVCVNGTWNSSKRRCVTENIN